MAAGVPAHGLGLRRLGEGALQAGGGDDGIGAAPDHKGGEIEPVKEGHDALARVVVAGAGDAEAGTMVSPSRSRSDRSRRSSLGGTGRRRRAAASSPAKMWRR